MNTEKRRSQDGISTPDAMPEPGQSPPGGRQSQLGFPGQGGGYLDFCSSARPAGRAKKNRRDPRIEELRRVGVGHVWVRVAEAIGFESFMAAWIELNSNPAVIDDRHRIVVPTMTKYHRFQRNLLVLDMAVRGLSPEEISRQVEAALDEAMTPAHVQRLLRRYRKLLTP